MAIEKITITDDERYYELNSPAYLGEWVEKIIDKLNEIIDEVNKE